jgi:hypothetical protein
MRARITWQMTDGFCGDLEPIREGLLRILRVEPIPGCRYVEDSLHTFPTSILRIGGKVFHSFRWTMELRGDFAADICQIDLFWKIHLKAQGFFPQLLCAQVRLETFRMDPLGAEG